MIQKVILYGAGKRCRTICRILGQFHFDAEIVIVDSSSDQWGNKIENYCIEPPTKIRELSNAILCITIADMDAERNVRERLLQEYPFNIKKVISYNKLVLEAYKGSAVIRQEIMQHVINANPDESVLFDCYSGIGLGGMQAWTTDICEALIQNGKERVYIISDRGEYDVPSLLENHIIYAGINHMKREKFSIDSILSLIEVIMAKLPCKVVTRETDDLMLAAYMVRRCYPDMVEIISVIHGSNEKIYENYMDFRECSDIYIGVSQDIKEDMIRKGVEPEKVYSMTCPFPCEHYIERSYTEGYLAPIHIGYAGRLDGMKNQPKRMDLLLKLAKVLADKKVHFKMTFAGDGPARQEMEEFVKSNNLDENVQFLGRLKRSQLSGFWRQQDICANLADFEGRSISIIEAMGNGTVPVVTATSGVKEDIIDGVNGYIVPIGDYRSMAEKIQYLSEHKEHLREMGKLAHDAVYPKSRMEPHLRFWEEILSQRVSG